jgi:hypothetical protein
VTDAVPHPHGGLVASLVITVGDIVMDQRDVLEVLDGHGEIEAAGGGLAEELTRDDRQGGSQSLAAADDLSRHAGTERRDVGHSLELLGESVLNLRFGVAEERLQVGVQEAGIGRSPTLARVAGVTRWQAGA